MIDLKDPQQRKIFDRRIDRQLAKQGRGHEDSFSDYRLIAEGTLYPKNPLYIEILKEVAMLSPRADLTDGDKPTGREKFDYKNWCFGGLEYIASRVRRNEKTVCRALGQLVADGVLRKRSYWRKDGRIAASGSARNKHCEYQLVRVVLEQHHPVFNPLLISSDEEQLVTVGSELVTPHHQVSDATTPKGDELVSYRPSIGDVPSREDDRDFDLSKGRAKRTSSTTTPSASPRRGQAEEPSLRSEEQKQKPKSKAKGLGVGGSLPESKPTKGLGAYLDDEPDVATGRNLLNTSSAPGVCPRCGEANGEHVNQPGMVCPVLKAKAAAAPRAFDVREA